MLWKVHKMTKVKNIYFFFSLLSILVLLLLALDKKQYWSSGVYFIVRPNGGFPVQWTQIILSTLTRLHITWCFCFFNEYYILVFFIWLLLRTQGKCITICKCVNASWNRAVAADNVTSRLNSVCLVVVTVRCWLPRRQHSTADRCPI